MASLDVMAFAQGVIFLKMPNRAGQFASLILIWAHFERSFQNLPFTKGIFQV